MRGLLLKTAVLLAVALAAGFAHSRVGPRLMLHVDDAPARTPRETAGIPKPPDLSAPVVVVTVPPDDTGAKADPQPPKPPLSDAVFISLAQAKELLDRGDAVFVDARNYDDYKAGHVLGAVHIDKKYFDGAAGADIARKNLIGQRVVIYCHGADCTDSEAVYKRLTSLNMTIGPIHIIKDGFPGWKAAGYPVERGG
jgi:rhodanese-related sulfurtransferase